MTWFRLIVRFFCNRLFDYFNNRLIVAALFSICESQSLREALLPALYILQFCVFKDMDSQGRPVVVCDNGTGVCVVIRFMLTESVVFYYWHEYGVVVIRGTVTLLRPVA